MSFGRLFPTRHATTCKNDSKFSMSFVRVNPSLPQRKWTYLLSSCSLYLKMRCLKLWTARIYNGLFLCKPLFLFRVVINATLSLLLGRGHSTLIQDLVHLKPRKVISSCVLDGFGWLCFFVWTVKLLDSTLGISASPGHQHESSLME